MSSVVFEQFEMFGTYVDFCKAELLVLKRIIKGEIVVQENSGLNEHQWHRFMSVFERV